MKKLAKIALVGSLSYIMAPSVLADLNDGLVAHYPFNGNANDESGNGNDGTVNGATLTEDRLGNANSAYRLDGNDYIEVQDSSLLDLTATFTISLWINQAQAQALGYRLVDKTTPGVHDGYGFDTYDNSTGKIMRLTGGIKSASANTAYSLNEWHYLVVTFSNGTSTFYLDGIADGSGNHGSSIQTNDLPLRIGTSRDSYMATLGFKGVMDDVRIYNRALSECEIQSLHTGRDECVSTTACQLYGVHDEGLNNTQFFTVSSKTFEIKALGKMKKAHDIEALDIHPQTAELFAASGKDTKIKGHLYQLNGKTGELTSIGSTGFKEIDGLSFHPDGTLWGWATGDGLVTIDTDTGQATLVATYPGEVEDLTWNTSGTMLFGVENVKNNPDAGVKLLAYDGNTLITVCEELTQSLEIEIEALDTLPDDTLLFGLHGKTSLPLGVIDVETCKIVSEQEISTSYNDVEGIAWPNCQ